eukprot:947444-Prymnesium_polylepis.2
MLWCTGTLHSAHAAAPQRAPVLPHVSAVDFDHAAVLRTCRPCSHDAAPQSISRGRRTASACGALLHPCTHAAR